MNGNQINTGNVELDKKIEEWISWDRNEKTLSEIRRLIEEKNFNDLAAVLLNRLAFGTAGLRGKMAAGYAAMNDLVIVQTGQGLLRYLEENHQDLLKKNGIVIGYDGRHNSKRFAELTASIFLHGGYPVRLFGTVVPTPYVPFSVTKYKTAVGVMVTASHNPKEDNGYKVYGWNGAQIISPADKDIQRHILKNLEPLETSWDTSVLKRSDKLSDPLKEVTECYMAKLTESLLPEHKAINKKSDVKFTYTAMHGVGHNYVKEAFRRTNLSFVAVEEQKDPDPDFTTVKFPNPEEGKSSLDLSFKTADLHKSKVILANDPDADRLAAAEKDERTGKWRVFNGNELGALLGWWTLHCYQTKYPNDNNNKPYMLASTVSSKILRTIAQAEDFHFVETLTGFKWMGNHTYDLLKANNKVLFAFEEAIGFMCGTEVLDKDGVSAAVHLATMVSYLHYRQMTLSQQLSEIYQVYGQHVSCNSYFICRDQEKIKRIFDRLRNYSGPDTYPKAILGNKYRVTNVRDLTTGYDNSRPDNKATLPVSKSSQMITFNFENGLVATLRTSGTEPKIKYYTELCASPSQSDLVEIQATLDEMVQGIVVEFLQPTQNGLVPKSD